MTEKDNYEDRTEIKDDRGFKLCELVKDGSNEYLEFKNGRRFDTLQLDNLYDQIELAYAGRSSR